MSDRIEGCRRLDQATFSPDRRNGGEGGKAAEVAVRAIEDM
jgi:hypothetical protein